MMLAEEKLTNEVIYKLYIYTGRKMQKLKGTPIYSRTTAQEIAHDAIAKTLSNERPWNPEKCPELFAHLAGCAKSIMSNEGNRMEVKMLETQDNLDFFYEKQNDSQSIAYPESMRSHQENRSTSLTPEEIQSALSDLKFLLEYLAENRDDLLALAEAMFIDQISKPQDLASHLGIQVAKVNTKKLALKRILIKMQEGA